MIHRRAWRFVAGLAVVATVLTIGATQANGSLPTPPQAYPGVTAPTGTCVAQRQAVSDAETAYSTADGNYRREIRLFDGSWRGTKASELGVAARAYYAAAIALSNARYRQSQCANLASLPPRVCVAIALELNRISDQEVLLTYERNSIEWQRRFYEEHRSWYTNYDTLLNENTAWRNANQDAQTSNAQLKALYELLAQVFRCPSMQRPLASTAAPGDGDVAVAALPDDETVEELAIADILADDEIVEEVETVMAPFVEPGVGDEPGTDFGDALASLIEDGPDGDEPTEPPTSVDDSGVSTTGSSHAR